MKKIFLSLFLIFVIIISSLMIFDYQKRFTIFKSVIPAYNIYKLLEIRTYLGFRDFSKINIILNNQINLSKKYGKNKTGFTNGINDVMSLVYKNILYKDEYSQIENSIRKWAMMNPDIYDAQIFYAKTIFEIYIKNKKRHNISDAKINEVKEILSSAIKISDSREEAYRIGTDLSLSINSLDDLNYYCEKHHNSFYGGSSPRTHKSLFRSYSIGKLGIYLNDNKKDIILGDNFVLNNKMEYEFNFIHRKNIDNFSLILATLPGIIIDFYKITVFSNNSEVILTPNDILITSRNAYNIEVGKSSVSFILTGMNLEEVIEFNTNQSFTNTEKISVLMRFRKADISNFKDNKFANCRN